jgi:heme-degrading monooxygenase HmoA
MVLFAETAANGKWAAFDRDDLDHKQHQDHKSQGLIAAFRMRFFEVVAQTGIAPPVELGDGPCFR